MSSEMKQNFLLSWRGRSEVKEGSGQLSVSVNFCICVVPLQELAEGRGAVAVLSLFFRPQLRESFLTLRKIEKRIVSEAIWPDRAVRDAAFALTSEYGQRVAIAGVGGLGNET